MMVTGSRRRSERLVSERRRHHELGHGDIGAAGRFRDRWLWAAPLVIGASRQRSDRGDPRDRAADEHLPSRVAWEPAAASLTVFMPDILEDSRLRATP